jgi:hypothetical protein
MPAKRNEDNLDEVKLKDLKYLKEKLDLASEKNRKNSKN